MFRVRKSDKIKERVSCGQQDLIETTAAAREGARELYVRRVHRVPAAGSRA